MTLRSCNVTVMFSSSQGRLSGVRGPRDGHAPSQDAGQVCDVQFPVGVLSLRVHAGLTHEAGLGCHGAVRDLLQLRLLTLLDHPAEAVYGHPGTLEKRNRK